MRLPSISVLQSFEAAARHQSYARAAEELHVTQAAVGRKVRDLEAHLSVVLFRRSGRGVELTDAGHALARRLRADLQGMRKTLEDTSAAGDTAQMLSVAALPGFSSRWLVPRLPDFFAKHQHVQLTLLSRTEPFDLLRDGVDLAIHFGRADWVGGTLTKMCDEEQRVVVSPLFRQRFDIQTAADLACTPLLHLATRRRAWLAYLSSLDAPTDMAACGTVFDQFSAMIQAAVHGLGAAIVPRFLIEHELAEGMLVDLDNPSKAEGAYYVVTPSTVSNPTANAFRDWVCAEAYRSTAKRKSQK